MTRTRHDQFSKQYLAELLMPLGEVNVGKEVPGEPRQIDVSFIPSPKACMASEPLGLLGQFVVTPCLLEPFRNQPSLTEVRDCLLKLFLTQAEMQRQARRNAEQLPENQLPKLWILAFSASQNLLEEFGAELRNHWGAGVYVLDPAFRSAIVALNQLPTTQDTLWLRMLGKGKTQQQAINELVALPRNHPLRSDTLELLASWRITIESSENLDEEAQELVMQLSPAYFQWREETLQEGRQEGQQEGVRVERRSTVQNLLKARFGELDAQLVGVVETIASLPPEAYTHLLLHLPNLSREDLLSRFQST